MTTFTACPCGYEFDADALGPYGCPNCHGDAVAAQVDRCNAAARQSRSRAARAAAGGKQVAVMLTPAAAAKLAQHLAAGGNIAGVINRLLERSRPAR